MPFNQKEQQIIDWGKNNKKTGEEVKQAIISYRTGAKTPEVKPNVMGNLVTQKTEKKTIGDYAKEFGEVAAPPQIREDINKRVERVGEIMKRDTAPVKKAYQVFGQGLGGAANYIENAINQIPGAKKVTETIGSGVGWLANTKPIQAIGEKIGSSKTLQEAVSLYDSDQDFKDTVDATANIIRAGGDIDAVVSGAEFTKNVVGKLKDLVTKKPTIGDVGLTKGEVSSSVHDWDRPIESGDMPVEKVFSDPRKGVFTTDAYNHVVGDAALKIEKRLGKEAAESFRNSVKPTMDSSDIMETANKIIDGTIKAPPALAKDASGMVGGAIQKGQEILERFPRQFKRYGEDLSEAAVKAERIKTASPAVKEAIKSGLDDRVINTITTADEVTNRAYKEMLDIADNTKKPGATLKPVERPEIVAGRAASEQYKIIDTKRKFVGRQIGEAVDELSKKTKVLITESQTKLDGILKKQGIKTVIDENGVKLDFSSSKFTPAERARIKELYELANEGGEKLTPRQIYDKDQLFSKLQRETRMEGIGDILIDIGNGEKQSLFRAFRDVFSDNLEIIDPTIKELNREYRKLITMTDDIENTIIKRGNYETTKGIDPAEFAQTNLRRLDSDALSAADYRAMVNKMDKLARELGYQGAKADELITFANELRRLFPEVIPSNSFSGGIKTGVGNFLKEVYNAGTPNLTDQQRALRQLLESLINDQPLVPKVSNTNKNSIISKNPPKTGNAIPREIKTNVNKATPNQASGDILASVKNNNLASTAISKKFTTEQVGSKGVFGKLVKSIKETPNKQGGFIRFPGGKVVKQIDSTTKDEMIKAIDYIRLKKPYKQEMENLIGYLAEKYGITSKKLGDVANKFQDLIELTKTKDNSGRVVLGKLAQ